MPARSTPLLVSPSLDNADCLEQVAGIDHTGKSVISNIINEKPLTLFLNSTEIVTLMTIGDWPQLLALGYLRNQNMLRDDDMIEAVEHDAQLGVVVVRTARATDYESRLRKKIRTSGCAQGTIFGDVMADFEEVNLGKNIFFKISCMYFLVKQINAIPSLYLAAGAVHGTVLCSADTPLVYMEDVGRHNAVDKIAGWMWQEKCTASDKLLYTTGRLTSEMVIKTALMGIPVLISRSGFTSWGVELARKVGLTLVGRARGQRFVALAGTERLIYDVPHTLKGPSTHDAGAAAPRARGKA